MQAAITDLKGEIKALQDTQKVASDELAKVLSSGNADMTNALRDTRNLLIEQQKRNVVPASPIRQGSHGALLIVLIWTGNSAHSTIASPRRKRST
jgi:hypothetical protein